MYSLILLFAIELSMILFMGIAIPGTSLYNFLINPVSWDDMPLLGALSDVLFIGGTALIIAGLYAIKNEFALYAGISAIFISFGSGFYQFYQYYSKEALFGDAAGIITTMFIAGLVIMYIVTILDFARGQD